HGGRNRAPSPEASGLSPVAVGSSSRAGVYGKRTLSASRAVEPRQGHRTGSGGERGRGRLSGGHPQAPQNAGGAGVGAEQGHRRDLGVRGQEGGGHGGRRSHRNLPRRSAPH